MADKGIRAQVEAMLANASIASIRSWIKGKAQRLSAQSRERMLDQVTALIEKEAFTFKDLEDGVIGIEEAGNKIIFLYELEAKPSLEEIKTAIAKAKLPLRTSRCFAKSHGNKATATYAILQGNQLRVKWSEVHQKPRMDLEADKVVYDDIGKVIVLVANISSGFVELRYDRPEIINSHGSKGAYFKHYFDAAEELLSAKLLKSELQKAIKSIVDEEPSLVRLHRGGHLNKRNNYFSGAAHKRGADIRDDEEYQAMKAKGGAAWSYEDQSFYRKPEQSEGALSREVFSHVDTVTASLRVDAYCWDAEVEYAIKKLRELQ